jgi:hypothetical protein
MIFFFEANTVGEFPTASKLKLTERSLCTSRAREKKEGEKRLPLH